MQRDKDIKTIKEMVIKPEYLEETKKILDMVIEVLMDKVVLTMSDLMSLYLFADDVDGYFRCKNEEKVLGVVITTSKGVYKNPAVKMAYDYHVNIEKFLRDYGLTPLSRKKLMDNTSEDSDDLLRAFITNQK